MSRFIMTVRQESTGLLEGILLTTEAVAQHAKQGKLISHA